MMLQTRHPKPEARIFSREAEVGTLRCGVPAPCRRGTGVSSSDGFVALSTRYSDAERCWDAAARRYVYGATLNKYTRRPYLFCRFPQNLS